MRDEAEKRIGHLYPKVKITSEMVNNPENPRPDLRQYKESELTVIAYIWARAVRSPNPAYSQTEVPLASTFILSKMKGKEARIVPIVGDHNFGLAIEVGHRNGMEEAKAGTKLSRGANFQCLMSGAPISSDYIKDEGAAGRMGAILIAVVAEGNRERVYLPPTPEMQAIALEARPEWRPETPLPDDPRNFWTPAYGLSTYADLFTSRQLVALTTFSALAQEAREKVLVDALAAGDESRGKDYADAVGVFLGLVVSSQSDRMSTICTWDAGGPTWGTKTRNTFARQAIPMSWDFAEVNPLSTQSGSFDNSLDYTSKGILCAGRLAGTASQVDASTQNLSEGNVVSTDPPYYDNIAYADLSDFFYVWLRHSLRSVLPQLFATLAVPKGNELVATPYRHGGKESADNFFLGGMTKAMQRIADHSHPAFPVTIYYAFKQSETKNAAGTASTGWETFLAAVLEAGFALHGTWPMRTELANRMIGSGTNALASSVVLVCKRREPDAQRITRKQFRDELKQSLPLAIKELEHANIAPVDVAQASIGPGMAIFSAASAVLNPDDSPMTVREALIEINAALDDYLSQEEGELDSDSRFALTFFESFGYQQRDYGDAEGLAVARNISVAGVAEAGILRSVAGKVHLLQRSELPDDWDPSRDKRLCVWEATQQLIKRLEAGGETAAGNLLAQVKQVSGHGDLAANCRALAYRLYNHCEKTKQAEEARSYNGLVIAWPELERQASAASSAQSAPLQTSLI
jgi:putative DNA methylase